MRLRPELPTRSRRSSGVPPPGRDGERVERRRGWQPQPAPASVVRYRFIAYGEPEKLEQRAEQLRARHSGPEFCSAFSVRRVPRTSLVVVLIDDPAAELLQALRDDRWHFGGRMCV